MGNSNDAVGAGLIESLTRPGGNITGLSSITIDVAPKYLELLKSMAPRVSRLAVWVDGNSPAHRIGLKNFQAAAPRAGVTILTIEIGTSKEIDTAFPAMIKAKVQAFVFQSSPQFFEHRIRIVEFANKNGLPFVSGFREFAEAGGLISYGHSLASNYRLAAGYVDKIFKGAKPADLPVEQPTIYELYVNRKTAKALGLFIPQSLLISADKVIE